MSLDSDSTIQFIQGGASFSILPLQEADEFIYHETVVS